jgi:hypothetical protein
METIGQRRIIMETLLSIIGMIVVGMISVIVVTAIDMYIHRDKGDKQ